VAFLAERVAPRAPAARRGVSGRRTPARN
jgi:hypothetical protein